MALEGQLMSDFLCSAESFAEEIYEKNRPELDELRELLRILEQLDRRRPRIYTISVTSNL